MRTEAGQLEPADAFSFLLGRWSLERVVRGLATVSGELQVSRSCDGEADYRERVTVTTARAATFSASQRYVVRRTMRGWIFCFAETGTLFQEVSFQRGADGCLVAEATHHCKDDWYRSRYQIGPGSSLHIHHAVSGSHKEYVSDTRLCLLERHRTEVISDSGGRNEGRSA